MLAYIRAVLDQRRKSVLEAERIAFTQDWPAFHRSLEIAYDKRALAADRDHNWRVAKLAVRKRREIDLAADRLAGVRLSIAGGAAPAR